MTWLKVDDRMPDHPKIIGLAPATKWTLVEIWCYCAAHRTNGHVPFGAARKIASPKSLTQLEEAGLLVRNGRGWNVHDWLDHNVSKEEHDARLEATAERQRKWREAHRNDDGTLHE